MVLDLRKVLDFGKVLDQTHSNKLRITKDKSE